MSTALSPITYFKSAQFQWSMVIFGIGVVLACLTALVAYFSDQINGKALIVAAISALIVGFTRLAEGINDASRAAKGDVQERDVTPLVNTVPSEKEGEDLT